MPRARLRYGPKITVSPMDASFVAQNGKGKRKRKARKMNSNASMPTTSAQINQIPRHMPGAPVYDNSRLPMRSNGASARPRYGLMDFLPLSQTQIHYSNQFRR